ncbi:U-box domain-containing protein [Globomyces pollinis-pini]|nr:U-box domain-containing protein [Globomyces pollinis-pini]
MNSDKAVQEKLLGNSYFSSQNYSKAITHYSNAIILDPLNHIYFSNRAISYFKLLNYSNCIADCLKAIDLNNNAVKPHYYLAQCYLFNNTRLALHKSLSHFRTAYHLAINDKLPLAVEIAQAYRNARKVVWEFDDNLRRLESQNLYSKLVALVNFHRASVNQSGSNNNQSTELADQANSAHMDTEHPGEHHTTIENSSQQNKINHEYQQEQTNNEENKNSNSDQINLHDIDHDDLLTQLDSLLLDAEHVAAKRPPVPDYYTGKISFEIMVDPVISPSGITYDKTEILEHLRVIGPFDPLTRQPLVESDLYPNLALKESIETYLDGHGWAIDY